MVESAVWFVETVVLVEAMRRLTGCVADLQEVQDAKHALAALSPDEVRAALLYRRTVRETG